MRLAEELKNSVKRFKKLCPNDKSDPPSKYACPKCRLKVGWFWLESDYEDLFPSQWMKQLCLCEVISHVSGNLNKALSQRDVSKRFVEDNSRTKRYSPREIEQLYLVVDELEVFIKHKAELLKSLNELRKSADPNSEYYKRRKILAERHNAWKELFDCMNQEEAEKTLRDLYESGSDKFLEELEKIKEGFA